MKQMNFFINLRYRMFVNLFQGLRGNSQINILICGLDKSGKTTILNKLKIGEIESTNVAIGLVEISKLQNISFTIISPNCADEKFRPLWKYFSQNTKGNFIFVLTLNRRICIFQFKGLIFVVDSCERTRILESKYLLNKLLKNDELKDAVLLVFANKQVCFKRTH
jgi:GTPase SAR1 family protein